MDACAPQALLSSLRFSPAAACMQSSRLSTPAPGRLPPPEDRLRSSMSASECRVLRNAWHATPSAELDSIWDKREAEISSPSNGATTCLVAGGEVGSIGKFIGLYSQFVEYELPRSGTPKNKSGAIRPKPKRRRHTLGTADCAPRNPCYSNRADFGRNSARQVIIMMSRSNADASGVSTSN